MLGGPALAALGALRSGAGLAVLAVPAPLAAGCLTVAPAATGLALPVDSAGRLVPSEVAALLDRHASGFGCLVVGPGFGDDQEQRTILMRLVGQEAPPAVIDADALNALAQVRDFHGDFRRPAILTPHPGEYRRLAAALAIEADPTDPDTRAAAAERLAQRLGCVVCLKGAGTVVSDGQRTWTNTSGNVCLATGGSGDVLAGIIGGLVAQYCDGELSLYDCARLGVAVHGRAADRWQERFGDAGMLAGDLLAAIPPVLADLRA
jgi:NAD(P)H-hydrate epimerase